MPRLLLTTFEMLPARRMAPVELLELFAFHFRPGEHSSWMPSEQVIQPLQGEAWAVLAGRAPALTMPASALGRNVWCEIPSHTLLSHHARFVGNTGWPRRVLFLPHTGHRQGTQYVLLVVSCE
jgi:hypothetical protein